MEAFIEHLQDKWIAYVVILACASPIVIIFRKYTFPVIRWAVELGVYSAALHIVTCGLVAVTNWFKTETQMEALVERRINPGWKVPLKEFWNREAYSPSWIFYAEIVGVIIIFGLMLKYRPWTVQKFKKQRPNIARGSVPGQAARGGYGPGKSQFGSKGRRRR